MDSCALIVDDGEDTRRRIQRASLGEGDDCIVRKPDIHIQTTGVNSTAPDSATTRARLAANNITMPPWLARRRPLPSGRVDRARASTGSCHLGHR